MNRFIMGYVVGALVTLLCLATAKAETRGKENWFIQVDELSLNYKKYQPSSRHPLFYNSTMKEGIELNMNNDLGLGYLFWDNTIHTATNSGQYYLIGWQFKFGVHVTEFFDFQYEHHSQHVLDSTYPYMKFPVEDSLGFKLTIIGGHSRGSSLF